jgi:hypothetical protein
MMIDYLRKNYKEMMSATGAQASFLSMKSAKVAHLLPNV